MAHLIKKNTARLRCTKTLLTHSLSCDSSCTGGEKRGCICWVHPIHCDPDIALCGFKKSFCSSDPAPLHLQWVEFSTELSGVCMHKTKVSCATILFSTLLSHLPPKIYFAGSPQPSRADFRGVGEERKDSPIVRADVIPCTQQLS